MHIRNGIVAEEQLLCQLQANLIGWKSVTQCWRDGRTQDNLRRQVSLVATGMMSKSFALLGRHERGEGNVEARMTAGTQPLSARLTGGAKRGDTGNNIIMRSECRKLTERNRLISNSKETKEVT